MWISIMVVFCTVFFRMGFFVDLPAITVIQFAVFLKKTYLVVFKFNRVDFVFKSILWSTLCSTLHPTLYPKYLDVKLNKHFYARYFSIHTILTNKQYVPMQYTDITFRYKHIHWPFRHASISALVSHMTHEAAFFFSWISMRSCHVSLQSADCMCDGMIIQCSFAIVLNSGTFNAGAFLINYL